VTYSATSRVVYWVAMRVGGVREVGDLRRGVSNEAEPAVDGRLEHELTVVR